MASASWSDAFVAMSVMLDVPLHDAVIGLSEDAKTRTAPLVRALSAASKADRAKALASVVTDIARSIDELAIQ